jgi:hypothetical protein
VDAFLADQDEDEEEEEEGEEEEEEEEEEARDTSRRCADSNLLACARIASTIRSYPASLTQVYGTCRSIMSGSPRNRALTPPALTMVAIASTRLSPFAAGSVIIKIFVTSKGVSAKDAMISASPLATM